MKMLLLSLLLLASHIAAAIPTTIGPRTLTATANTGAISIQDQAAVTVQITSVTGTAGAQLQGSLDGTNWVTMYTAKVGTSALSLTMTANGLYEANLAGLRYVRVYALYVTSGTLAAIAGLGRGPASTQYRLTTATTPTP